MENKSKMNRFVKNLYVFLKEDFILFQYVRIMILMFYSCTGTFTSALMKRHRFFSNLAILYQNKHNPSDVHLDLSGKSRVQNPHFMSPVNSLFLLFDLIAGGVLIIGFWGEIFNGYLMQGAATWILSIFFVYLLLYIILRKTMSNYKKKCSLQNDESLLYLRDEMRSGIYIRILIVMLLFIGLISLNNPVRLFLLLLAIAIWYAFYQADFAVTAKMVMNHVEKGMPLSEALAHADEDFCEPKLSLYMSIAEKYGFAPQMMHSISNYYQDIIQKKINSNSMYKFLLICEFLFSVIFFVGFYLLIFPQFLYLFEQVGMSDSTPAFSIASISLTYASLNFLMSQILIYVMYFAGSVALFWFGRTCARMMHRKKQQENAYSFYGLLLNLLIVLVMAVFYSLASFPFRTAYVLLYFFFAGLALLALPSFCYMLTKYGSQLLYHLPILCYAVPKKVRLNIAWELQFILKIFYEKELLNADNLALLSGKVSSIILSVFLKLMAAKMEKGYSLVEVLNHPLFPEEERKNILQAIYHKEVKSHEELYIETIDSFPLNIPLIALHLLNAAVVLCFLIIIYSMLMSIPLTV